MEKCLELSEISFKDEVEGNHKYNLTHVVTPKLVRGKPRKVRHVKREIDQDDTTPNTSPEKKKLKKDIVAEAVLETIEKDGKSNIEEYQIATTCLKESKNNSKDDFTKKSTPPRWAIILQASRVSLIDFFTRHLSPQ